MKVKGKHVLLFFVLLLTGFIFAFSYDSTTERHANLPPGYEKQWQYEDELRQKINEERAKVNELQETLLQYQAEVRILEEDLASLNEEQQLKAKNLLEDLDRLRKIAGKVAVEGPGIEVVLEDSSYLPEGADPNDYIVHEAHLQLVVHELFVAGAEAVAINGFRLSSQSYILCTGPVIEVDGYKSTAPFVITAIGDSDHLEAALSLYGGVKDQLLNDDITVRIQKKNLIVLDPPFTERG